MYKIIHLEKRNERAATFKKKRDGAQKPNLRLRHEFVKADAIGAAIGRGRGNIGRIPPSTVDGSEREGRLTQGFENVVAILSAHVAYLSVSAAAPPNNATMLNLPAG